MSDQCRPGWVCEENDDRPADLSDGRQLSKDPYRKFAGIYDLALESMNRGLRVAGIRMWRPEKGMKILDVGCGTGTHLEIYGRYDCDLYGLDSSPSMLAVARKRLGSRATLDLGNATHMPYADGKFDLIITMLCLHEMLPQTRAGTIMEMKRVLKQAGRMLLIDFNPGPIQPPMGWISKVIIFLAESAAGREHFRNYREFIASGGLATLTTQHDLRVENRRILADGTFAMYLAKVRL